VRSTRISRDSRKRISAVAKIVVVGTPEYLKKYSSPKGTIVAAEVDLINQRLTGSPGAAEDRIAAVGGLRSEQIASSAHARQVVG
jgi:hypothetical protein